jgi:iron complex transport system ATP-binding protein
LLQAVDVSFAYGRTPVIRGVSLTAAPGSLVGLLGPNGSGKTTLLRLLAGTRAPSKGQVVLDNVPLSSLPRTAIARRMAVVPQETHLAFDYTVLEMVLMGRFAHLGAFAVEGPGDIRIALASLDATGAAHLAGRYFSTLSGGEKQRVIIAAALAQVTGAAGGIAAGAVLLLDETTAALDLKYQLGVAAMLQSLHRDRSLTIFVSTHDLALAARVCDTVVMLDAGTVLAAGPTAEVLTEERIRRLYGVEVEVSRHHSTGRPVVVPLGVADTGGQG